MVSPALTYSTHTPALLSRATPYPGFFANGGDTAGMSQSLPTAFTPEANMDSSHLLAAVTLESTQRPPHAPEDWDAGKPEAERTELVASMRRMEGRWACRCLGAFVVSVLRAAAVVLCVVLVART